MSSEIVGCVCHANDATIAQPYLSTLQGDPVTPEYRANHRGGDRLAGPDRIEIKKTPSLQTDAGFLVVEVELRVSSRCHRTTP
jgi:hypothetical protein